jgi:peptidyl-prolyl cis-trans isomerase D
MGVLEQMRSGSDSTFMQVILAMVVVAFVGLYARPQGDVSGVVATVDGVRIMDTDYGRAYRNELRRIEATTGRTLSDAEQKQLGERVRQQLIEEEVILQEAQRLGVEVSDTEVARQLLQIPTFHDDSGKYNPEMYARFLKRMQFTKADFEERMRKDLLRAKLRQLAFMGASLSEPALREAFVEQETRVDLTMVRIRPGAFEKDVVITDEERTQWIADNGPLVQETYDRDFDRLYNHPEQVRMSLIRLAVRSDGPGLADLVPILKGVREQVEGGADFAELAKRWSEDPSAARGGDLGLRPIEQLSLEDDQAIQGLEAGGLTKVYTTDSDVRLVRVDERVSARVDTLQDVTDSIAERLMRAERVPALAASFAEDELLPRWKVSGEVPQDLLDAHSLTATTTGPIPTERGGNPFAPPQPILDDARSAEVGSVLPEVYEEGGTLYVAQLTDRTDPDMDVFEDEKQSIREAVLARRRMDFYTAWVADLKSQATIE